MNLTTQFCFMKNWSIGTESSQAVKFKKAELRYFKASWWMGYKLMNYNFFLFQQIWR